MSVSRTQLLELPNYVKYEKKEKTFGSRQELKETHRFLIKLGSSVVTREDGKGVALPRLTSIVEQIAICHSNGIECCIVSSGAIAFGKKILLEELNMKELSYTLNISQKRAAAALGQPGLMSLYKTLFAQYNINVAQVLISNGSMGQEDARDIIKSTLSELLSLNIIPIINTNDAVNVPDSGRSDDVNLCDNDILAVALAAEIESDLVILATDVNGLYDKPPSEPGSKLISNFQPMQQTGIKFGGTSSIGTGGMDSKVKAATYALSRGVSPVICNGEEPNFITALLAGDSVGTFFYQ